MSQDGEFPDLLIDDFAQLKLPLPLLIIAWTSIIPLFLNIVCLICWAKYPSMRKNPGNLLSSLAFIYLLNNLHFIVDAIITLWFPDIQKEAASLFCQADAAARLIIGSLIFSFNTALNIYLIQVTRGNELFRRYSTARYQLSAWGFSLINCLLTFSVQPGTNKNTYGECFWSLGYWDYVLPGIFCLTLFYCGYRIRKIHKNGHINSTVKFLRSFRMYLIFSCLYIGERAVQIIFSFETCAFDLLPWYEKTLVGIGFTLGICITYTIFIVQYTNPYAKKKIKDLFGIKQDEKANLLLAHNRTSDGYADGVADLPTPEQNSTVIQKENSDNVRKRANSGTLNKAFLERRLRKGYLDSILFGMNYLVTKLEETAKRLDPRTIQNLKTNFEKTEQINISMEDIKEINPKLFHILQNFEIRIYDGSFNVPYSNMLLRMVCENRDLLAKLKTSLDLISNQENAASGFTEIEDELIFLTYDERFIIKIIDEKKAKEFLKLSKALFHYQCFENQASSIEKIIGVFQFCPNLFDLKHYFLVVENIFSADDDILYNVHGPKICFNNQNLLSVKSLNSTVTKFSEIQPEMSVLIKDIEFLRSCGIFDYSLMLRVFSLPREEASLMKIPEREINNKKGDTLKIIIIENERESEISVENEKRIRVGRFILGNIEFIAQPSQFKRVDNYAQKLEKTIKNLYETCQKLN